MLLGGYRIAHLVGLVALVAIGLMLADLGRLVTGRRGAALGTVLFVGAPQTLYFAPTGYVDVPMAAFATGFLVLAPEGPFSDGDRRIYLVTNKHAVSRDGTHRTDPVKRIGLHFNALSDEGRYVKRKPVRLTLWKDRQPLWRYHPRSDVDIAVLDVTDLLLEHPEIRYATIDSSTLQPWRKLVQAGIDAGREILLLGYPHNVTTAESNFTF